MKKLLFIALVNTLAQFSVCKEIATVLNFEKGKTVNRCITGKEVVNLNIEKKCLKKTAAKIFYAKGFEKNDPILFGWVPGEHYFINPEKFGDR